MSKFKTKFKDGFLVLYQAPKKPVRAFSKKTYNVVGESLADILTLADREGLDLEDSYIESEYCDSSALLIEEKYEDYESFNLRMEDYKKDLEKYRFWKKENAQEIERARKEKGRVAEEKRIAGAKRRKQKEVERLKKKIKSLEGE